MITICHIPDVYATCNLQLQQHNIIPAKMAINPMCSVCTERHAMAWTTNRRIALRTEVVLNSVVTVLLRKKRKWTNWKKKTDVKKETHCYLCAWMCWCFQVNSTSANDIGGNLHTHTHTHTHTLLSWANMLLLLQSRICSWDLWSGRTVWNKQS